MNETNVALAEAGKELISGFDVMDPTVFFGILVGAVIPAVFSAMLILGVDKNAQRMVAEITASSTQSRVSVKVPQNLITTNVLTLPLQVLSVN